MPFRREAILRVHAKSIRLAAEIDKEVEEILAKAHGRVRELLTAQKPLLEKLAALLLEKEVLEGEELRRLVRAETKTDRVTKSAPIH